MAFQNKEGFQAGAIYTPINWSKEQYMSPVTFSLSHCFIPHVNYICAYTTNDGDWGWLKPKTFWGGPGFWARELTDFKLVRPAKKRRSIWQCLRGLFP